MDKRIEIKSRATGAVESHVVQQNGATLAIKDSAEVKIAAAPGDLAEMLREGDDLVLRFADGTVVRLDGYFACPVEDIASLICVPPGTSEQLVASLSDAACRLPSDVSSEALNYTFNPANMGTTGSGVIVGGGGISGGLLGGLGALAVGGGVAAAGGGGSDADNGGAPGPNPPVDTTPPSAPIVDRHPAHGASPRRPT